MQNVAVLHKRHGGRSRRIPVRAAAPSEPTVAVGAIVALRLFDVAYAIDLARAEALLAGQARDGATQPAQRHAAQGDGVRCAAGRLQLEPVALILEGGGGRGRHCPAV